MSSSPARLVRSVAATELRGLLRDRRAFLMAVVLPMLLFPGMFLGMDALDRASEESLSEREVRVAHDLRELDAATAARVRERLAEPALHLTLEEVDAADLRRADPHERSDDDGNGGDESDGGDDRERVGRRPEEPQWREEALELLGDGRQLLLLAEGDAAPRPPRVALVHDGSNALANEARGRVRDVLREVDREVRSERIRELVGEDPAAVLASEARDVAPAEDTAGHALGELLPIVLVLMLISGGSFAALGAFAGERESGTIETLLVQPVPAMVVASGKFVAVLATACAALVGNSASFLVCLSLGWGDALGSALPVGASLGRLAVGLFLFLPTAVLLSAVLCLVSARAKSFREGQHYVFPLVLIASALAMASTQDRVEASSLLALVPVTGATLVLRDTLAGSFPPLPAAVSFAASAGWAWLVLRRLAQTLDAERLFSTQDSASELAARRVQSRRALAWGAAAVALIYVVGGRMQTASPVLGLAATLWILVPAVALAAARGTARRAGEPLGRVLGLGAPRPVHLLGALLLAPGLALGVLALFDWQNAFLPLPADATAPQLLESFAHLSPVALVLLMALSPGWNEELLFRGAILSGLRRDLSPAKVVLWQALLFGAAHASLHRFLPTAVVGAVLATITLRTRRLWPAVVLHTSYNALLVLDVPEKTWWSPAAALGLAAVGLLAFVAGRPTGRTVPEQSGA